MTTFRGATAHLDEKKRGARGRRDNQAILFIDEVFNAKAFIAQAFLPMTHRCARQMDARKYDAYRLYQ
jgi:hypothetical protein